MTYKNIREIIKKPKDIHHTKKMTVFRFGRFSVMYSDKVDGIILDTEIADMVSDHRWCLDTGGYPVANYGNDLVRLFDLVMALGNEEKPKGYYVDHINHDKLDNRRTNLRFVSPQESSRNMPLKGNNTSGYTGVSQTKNGRYRAYITVNKKRIELGHYATAIEARQARQEAEDRFGFLTRPKTVRDKCNVAFLCELEGER